MKLTRKQKEFLLEIYVPFLSLDKEDIIQKEGVNTRDVECGRCFGAWLVFFYELKSRRYIAPSYLNGEKYFYKRMGIKFSNNKYDKYDKYDKLKDFMIECGTAKYNDPFGATDWELPPHEVIRNMLEKGA